MATITDIMTHIARVVWNFACTKVLCHLEDFALELAAQLFDDLHAVAALRCAGLVSRKFPLPFGSHGSTLSQ